MSGSDFTPLKWSLQFDLKNQGSDVIKSIKLFDSLRAHIDKTNASLIQFNKTANSGNILKNLSLFQTRKNLLGSKNNKLIGSGPNSSYGAPGSPGSSVDSSGGGAFLQGAMGSLSTAAMAAGAALVALGYGVKKGLDLIMETTDKLVSSFTERQSALRTYGLILGSENEAKKQYFNEAALAQKTELTQTDVRGFSNRLITAGFRGDDLERARLNIADLVTMRPEHLRASSANQLGELYSKVHGLGYVQEGLLNRTASRFVSSKGIREEIASQMGIKPEDVQDALKKRKVTSDVFFNALQKASLKQLGTEKTGQFATNAAGTLGGLLSNQGEAEENLYRTIDPDKIKGVELYKKSIQDVMDAMTAGTKTGDNLRYLLEDVAEVGTGFKAAGNELKVGFLDEFSKGYREMMEEIGISSEEGENSMVSLGYMMKSIGEIIGKYVAPAAVYFVFGLKMLGSGITFIVDKIKELWNSFVKFGIETAVFFNDIIEGVGRFFSGIGQYLTGMYTIASGLASLDWSKIKEGKSIMASTKFSEDENDRKARNESLLSHAMNNAKDVTFDMQGKLAKRGEASISSQTNNPHISADIINDTIITHGSSGEKHSNGGGGEGGKLFSFYYANPLPEITNLHRNYLNPYSNPAPPIMDVTPPQFLNNRAQSPYASDVKVENINIFIQGDHLSSEEISTRVVEEISQTFGRLSRSPYAGAL